MKPEFDNWWRQAQYDLESAKLNLRKETAYICAFLSQQAVEKGFKALDVLWRKKW